MSLNRITHLFFSSTWHARKAFANWRSCQSDHSLATDAHVLIHTSRDMLTWMGNPTNSLPLPRKLPAPPGTPPIRTQKRAATILPNFVGLKFAVHNGKNYQEIVITEEMVGRKLGEYVPYVPLCFLFFPSFHPQMISSFIHRGWKYIEGRTVLMCCLSTCRTRKRFTYKQSKNK